MNTANTTTGLVPICVGSTEIFQSKAYLNGEPWNISGGSATVNMTDSNGATYALTGTISADGYTAKANWTVTGSPSATNLYGPWTWVRSWTLTDGSGRVQVSRPIAFAVMQSPGVPV